MALIECGTHALVDAVFGSVDRFSEHKLARRLLASLTEGTLLLADRNFAGYELWGLARATGAHLAWRIKKNLVFPPVRVLPDGSYLSIMRTALFAFASRRPRPQAPGLPARALRPGDRPRHHGRPARPEGTPAECSRPEPAHSSPR